MSGAHKVPLADLASRLATPWNVFVCCASFEGRCLTVAQNLNPSQVAAVLVVQNGSISSLIGTNAAHLQKMFGDRCVQADAHPSNPVATEDNLAQGLKSVIPEDAEWSLLLDITTFTREALLVLLNQLRRLGSRGCRLTLAYTGASRYGTDESDSEKVWLTRGVKEVRSVLGYPGGLLPSRKTHLIVLVGFETERVSSLISSYEPAIISLGYGPKESSITDEHHKLNLMFHQQAVSLYDGVNRFEFAPNSPAETKNSIIAQAAKFPNTNVVVAPLNTKLSTVGAAFAAFADQRLHLCYAEAAIYNFSHYSSIGDSCYLLQVDRHLMMSEPK